MNVGLEMFKKDHSGVKVDDSEPPTPGGLTSSGVSDGKNTV